MPEPPIRSDITVDDSLLQRTARVRADFHKAWQEAAQDGPEPKLDSYLASFSEPERNLLQGELEKIAEEGRRLRASANEHTQDESPGEVKQSSEQSVTADIAPDTKVDDNQQTTDFQPAAAEVAGTLDFVREQADPASTLDEKPGIKAAATDFSVDDTVNETAGDSQFQSVAGYEILGILGRGAMGVVYKARQRGLRRLVALKMILAGGHASEVELARFRIEAEAVGQLQHPNIVQVYEVSEHNGCPFLSLEFINGDSLQKKLGGQPQPVVHAAQMVQVLAHAMDLAHRKGIIHRDLKPANVMLMLPQTAGSGESSTISHAPLVETLYGIPKIADFGLAKRLEEDAGQTRSGTILGTPSYMAPEQAEGRSKGVGPLADQYALGAILYEMLTGRPPFRGETVLDTLELVRKQEPVPPSQLQPKVPRDLETICLKALQKETQKRYSDCARLAEDLRRFVAGEPILGRPVSAPERFVRWCRRNPKVAALIGLSAALLVGVTIVSTVSAVLVSKARDRAEQHEREARKAQGVATEQASLALNTVGDLVSRVQEKLQESQAARELRGEILELAMERVKQVAEAGLNSTGLDARILASAHIQIGGIYQRLSRLEEARAEYQKGYVILSRLAQENPDSDKARGNLAVALVSLGDMKVAIEHDVPAAREFYERALQLRREIHDRPRNGELAPEDVNLSLASSYDKLVEVPRDAAEARHDRETARKLRQEAVALAPHSLAARHELWKSHLWFGDDAAHEGSLQDALASYDSTLKLGIELVGEHPKNRSLRYELGQVWTRLGEIQLRLGKGIEAGDSYRQALEKYRHLSKDDTSDNHLRVAILGSRYGLATAALVAGDTKSALDEYRRLLRYWEDRLGTQPNDREVQVWIMLCAARCGERVRASQMAEELRKQRPMDAENLVLVAQGYGLGIGGVSTGKPEGQLNAEDRDQQTKYTATALAALRQAKDLGYKGWATLETEPDFGELLKNPDFQAMVREGKLKEKASAGRK